MRSHAKLSRGAVLVLLWAWATGAVRAQGPAAELTRLVVGTRFSITARAFVEPLGTRRLALEAEAARLMAELCAAELSYVEWRALTNAPASNDPAWILRGVMASEGTAVIPAVVLQFDKLAPAAQATPLLREPLYLANDLDQPTQEETRLHDDLVAKVRSVFENAQILDKVQTRFLAAIPLPAPDRGKCSTPAGRAAGELG